MQEIDLSEFGFVGKKILFEGKISKKNSGNKLLFLFAETHKEPTSIGPNIRNCIRLIDEGIVSYIGLEFNPMDVDAPDKYTRTGELAADVDAIIKSDLHDHGEPRFGTTIRRLSDQIVEVTEDMTIWKEAEEIEFTIKEKCIDDRRVELFNKWMSENPKSKPASLDTRARAQAETDPKVIEQFRVKFGDHEINMARDKAMVEKLFQRWAAEDSTKAALLNAGRKHIQRIIQILPPECSFIYIDQPE